MNTLWNIDIGTYYKAYKMSKKAINGDQTTSSGLRTASETTRLWRARLDSEILLCLKNGPVNIYYISLALAVNNSIYQCCTTFARSHISVKIMSR